MSEVRIREVIEMCLATNPADPLPLSLSLQTDTHTHTDVGKGGAGESVPRETEIGRQCLCCRGPISEDEWGFYCDEFCREIGFQAYLAHWVEVPPYV